MRYAILLREIHRAATRPATRAVIESLSEEQAENGIIVRVQGLPALLLDGSEEAVLVHVAALLKLDVAVWEAEAEDSAEWRRCTAVPVVAAEPDADCRAVEPLELPELDPEFSAWSDALRDDAAFTRLSRSIGADGCREPLIVWQETGVLLDGHRRLAACRAVGEEWDLADRSFADRSAARRWVLERHLAGHLSRPRRDYLQGLLYLAQRREVGGYRRSAASSRGQSDHMTDGGSTALLIATAADVSERTVRRQAGFAAAVDALASRLGADLRRQLLSGGMAVSRAAVIRAAARGVRTAAEIGSSGAAAPSRRPAPAGGRR